MQFLLDTGTSANILDLQAVQMLGLKPENLQKVKNIGLGGGKVAIAAAKNLDVEIAHMRVAHVLAIVDLHGLETSFGHCTDGILSYDILRHYVVQLDFQRQTLTLSPVKGYHYRGTGDILFLADKKHSPDIHVTLNTSNNQHQQAVVGVDTSSDVTLLELKPADQISSAALPTVPPQTRLPQ